MGYWLYGICAKTLCTPNCYVMGSARIKGLLGPTAPQYCSARLQDGGETGSDLLPRGEDGGGKLKHNLTKEERRSEEKDQPHDRSRLRARAFCWCGNTQQKAN